MIRTQIQLTERQSETLKRLAAERGISKAELIRQAVDRLLDGADPEVRRKRALAAVGRHRSRFRDIAREHDRYLAEDFRA